MTETELKALLLSSYRTYHGKDEQSVRQALFSMFRAMSSGLFDDLPDGVNPGEDAERTRVQQKLRYDQFSLTREVAEAIIDEITEGGFINLIRRVNGLDATTVTCTMLVNVGNITISTENVDGIATPTPWVQQNYAAKSVVTHTVDNKLQTWFAVRATSTVPGSAPTPAQVAAGKSADWVSHEVKALPRTIRFKLVGTPALNDQIQLTIGNQNYTYTYAASDSSVNDLAAGVTALAVADTLFQVTNSTDALKSLSAAFASGVWQTSLEVLGILAWSAAQVYLVNSVVLHNGQLWTNNAQTLAGEEPGVSPKWISITYADVNIPKSLATQADQSLYSTAASTWAAFSFTSQWRSFVSTVKAAWDEASGILKSFAFQVDTAPAVAQTTGIGKMIWNDTYGSIETLLKGGNADLLMGQQLFTRVRNAQGSQITKGQAVYLFGSSGVHNEVKLASASTEATSSKTLGIVVETINNNNEGYAITNGVLRNVNTDHLTEGALVWLSTTDGLTTSTRPTAPNHGVFLGMCIKKHQNVGVLYVSVANGLELEELHDVLINGIAANHILIWNDITKVWENKAQSNLALSSSQVGVHVTGTTNGDAGTSVSLTIGSLASGSARFVRLTVKARSASGAHLYGRTLDALWENTAGVLTQVGADSLGTTMSTGSLSTATIATSASGTNLQVTCTDVTGCGSTVSWEVFGEYY